MKINHSKPYFDKADKKSVTDTLEAGFVTAGLAAASLGETVSACLGKKYAVPTQSGTDALTSALAVLDLSPGSEIAVPAYICSAPLDALHLAGMKPVPVDIDRETLAVSPDLLNHNTKFSAVIAAHLFGIPAPFYKIRCENLIEDCAQTLCAEIDGRRVGSMGKLAVCSFYGTKLLTAGHGGAVSADDECLYRKLRSLMIHDKQDEWQPHFHFMMSDFNASLALAQFAKLEWMIKRRREIACRFMNALGEQGREQVGNIYSRFIVIADAGADRLIAEFSKAGIEAKRPVFLPLYRYLGYKDTDFPNAAWAHEYIVSVPLYPALAESEIEYIESFLEKHKDEMRCWPSA